MSGHDFFAQVALRQNHVRKEELSESEPRVFKNKFFKSSTSVCEKVLDKPYEEMLIEFDTNLEKLRDKFKPFMFDFTPQPGICKKSRELKAFQFRYEDELDRSDITRVLSGDGDWENVNIPDYRGPVGKWTGYYRTVFKYSSPWNASRFTTLTPSPSPSSSAV